MCPVYDHGARISINFRGLEDGRSTRLVSKMDSHPSRVQNYLPGL